MPSLINDGLLKKFKKVGGKSWEHLSFYSIYLPSVADTCGECPQVDISELDEVESRLDGVKGKHPLLFKLEDQVLIESFFKSGIFKIQKASHQFSLAFQSLGIEFGCPSLSIFYQAAYLCASGILDLHGVAVVGKTGTKKQWMIDIFNKVPNSITSDFKYPECLIVDLETGFNHKEFWELFKTVLNKTIYPLQEQKDFVSQLMEIPCNKFAEQRNLINYRANFWPFNEFISKEGVLDFNANLFVDIDKIGSTEEDTFLPLFALNLLVFASRKLVSYTDNSNAYKPEYDIFLSHFNNIPVQFKR